MDHPPPPRKPRSREITSRYKSPTPTPTPPPPRRYASPSDFRHPSPPDFRRPSPTKASSDASFLPKRPPPSFSSSSLWPSTRFPYSSMQSDRFSPSKSRPDHALKSSANVTPRPLDLRKTTPERKRTPLRRQSSDQAENARPPSENFQQQHRWPASSNAKLYGTGMSRSVDLSADRERHSTSRTLVSSRASSRPIPNSRAFSQSINEGPPLHTAARKLNLDSKPSSRASPIKSRRGTSTRDVVRNSNSSSPQIEQSIYPVRQSGGEQSQLASAALADAASDTSSPRSVGTPRGLHGNGTSARFTRASTLATRLWPDASSGRSRNPPDVGRLRVSIPDSEYAIMVGGKVGSRPTSTPSSDTKTAQGFVASSPWSLPHHLASSMKSPHQPLSPAKVPPMSSLRSFPSPTRSRGSTFSSPASSFSSSRSGGATAMLSFGAEARKGKKALTQVEEAYLHRILYNRLLQWRFVNARAEFATNTQRVTGEKLLYSVWAKTAELRKSVTAKRIKLQQARQTHKLNSIIGAQVSKLETWSNLHQQHSSALSGAVEALQAAVLRVPVDEGVRADTHTVKEAMTSAVDVVRATESSVASLLPKLDNSNKLVSELAQVAAQERTFLEECSDLLLIASKLEVEERSLRTHLVQFGQERARVVGHFMANSSTDCGSVLLSPS